MKHFDAFDLKYWVCDVCGNVQRYGIINLLGVDFCPNCYLEMVEEEKSCLA
jgi:hypothetical protein